MLKVPGLEEQQIKGRAAGCGALSIDLFPSPYFVAAKLSLH